MMDDIDIKDNSKVDDKGSSYRLKTSIVELFKGSLLYPLGVVPVRKIDISKYLKWLSLKYNGSLKYLENNLECRKDPSYILEGVKSIIPVILPYYCIIKKSLGLKEKYNLKVSYYSFIKDYHLIIKSQLYPITEKLDKMFLNEKYRVVVDSAPIFEKYNAYLTGQGKIGKNTLFIHKDYGSFVFLGEILTTIPVEKLIEEKTNYDKSNVDNVGYIDCNDDCICKLGCRECIKSCPSSAIDSLGINVSRCLSYLSIEHSGSVEEEFWKYFKDSFFGCDKCQMMCVYNKKLMKYINSKGSIDNTDEGIDIDKYLLSKEQISYLSDPKKILFMDEKEFKKVFKDTSFLRAKYQGITRNILIHLAVNKDKELMDIVDSDRLNPLVWSYVSREAIVGVYKKDLSK